MDRQAPVGNAPRGHARRRIRVVAGVMFLIAGLLGAFATTAQASAPPLGNQAVPGTAGLYGVACATATACEAVGDIYPDVGVAQRGVVVPSPTASPAPLR